MSNNFKNAIILGCIESFEKTKNKMVFQIAVPIVHQNCHEK